MGITSRCQEAYADYKLYYYIRNSIPHISATILLTIASGKLLKYFYARYKLTQRRNAAIEEFQATKRAWRAHAKFQITEKESEEITSLDFNELVTSLREGHLTAVQVLRAFQRKAAVEDETLNFVSLPLDWLNAEELAEELDKIPVSERSSKPLFGIPLSVKENEDVLGHDPTMGCSRALGLTAEQDSPRIKAFRDLGAIPFIRTNIPQALLAFGCDNPIYGTTVNPWDVKREPGGSSGGEGAAIACRASVFGMGSDIGGSVRIPAAWNGIPGLKPTAGRISNWGRISTNMGQTAVGSVVGPLASTVDGLIMAMRAFSSQEMWYEDPTIAHQLFNEEELSSDKRMTIGVLDYHGDDTAVCAAARRAVRETADLLASKGHRMISYKLRESESCAKYFSKAMFGDAGSHLTRFLYGDKVCGDMKPTIRLLELPFIVKKMFNFILRFLLPKYACDVVKTNEGVRSVSDWCDFISQLQTYRHRVIDDWRLDGIDAVLCPSMPVPAMPLGDPALAKSAVSYTIPWNVLNFSAGVVPVCKVTAEDTADDVINYPTKDMFHRILKKGLIGSEGLPITVQLVTLPFHEELCLRLMKEVETAVDFQPLNSTKR